MEGDGVRLGLISELQLVPKKKHRREATIEKKRRTENLDFMAIVGARLKTFFVLLILCALRFCCSSVFKLLFLMKQTKNFFYKNECN